MNAYKELPEGYTLAKEVDAAGNKKLAVLFNLAALLLTAAVFCAGCLIRFRGLPPLALMLENLWALEGMLGLFLLGMLAYLVLHELTHGAVYKLLTGEKLTFGIRLSCAYCGVPNIFVTRKTALWAVLAPFTLFTLLFLPLIALRSSYCALLFLLLFRFAFFFLFATTFFFFLATAFFLDCFVFGYSPIFEGNSDFVLRPITYG